MPHDRPRSRLVLNVQGLKREVQEREGRPVTYAEIAQECGVTPGALRKVAYPGTGRKPSWRLAEALIDYFDVPVERLIHRVPVGGAREGPDDTVEGVREPTRRYGSAARGEPPDYDPDALREAVREYLDRHGISQAELARRACVSKPVVGFALRGRRLGATSVEKLTKAMEGE